MPVVGDNTDITEAREPEEEAEMGTVDSVPDAGHGRPAVQPEPEGAGIPDDGVIGRSKRSLAVAEPEEARLTTENA